MKRWSHWKSDKVVYADYILGASRSRYIICQAFIDTDIEVQLNFPSHSRESFFPVSNPPTLTYLWKKIFIRCHNNSSKYLEGFAIIYPPPPHQTTPFENNYSFHAIGSGFPSWFTLKRSEYWHIPLRDTVSHAIGAELSTQYPKFETIFYNFHCLSCVVKKSKYFHSNEKKNTTVSLKNIPLPPQPESHSWNLSINKSLIN